jgi:hypothetical protein
MDTFDSDSSSARQMMIDGLAIEFERAYRHALKPTIEDYLGQNPELRIPLLRKLLSIELELR